MRASSPPCTVRFPAYAMRGAVSPPGLILAGVRHDSTFPGARFMPHVHRSTRACAALFAIAGLVPAGLAQPSRNMGGADTVWYCWYNEDTTFRCRLARARDNPGDRGAKFATPEARRSLYPRRGPLPPIVKTIHEHPARLQGRTITIPVFSAPLDPAFAAMLVQSVMCDIRPACRVRIFRSPAAVAEEYEEDPARTE